MSECNKCLWATRDGNCASWECEFVDKQEAYEAYKGRESEQCEPRRKSMIWQKSHTHPDDDRPVLVCTITKKGVKTIKTGYYTPMTGWVVGMNNNVIAWMELPEPPDWEE